MMNKSIFFIMLSVLALSAEASALEVSSKAKAVTIFMNGAQVTRTATAQIPSGQSEVKFVGLSPYIKSNSLQVKARGSNVTIMSVNSQQNYTNKTQNDKNVESLEQQKQQVTDKLNAEKVKNEVADEELAFISANKEVGGKDQSLQLASLKQVNDYYRSRISALKLQKLETNKSIAEYEKQLNDINRQIAELNGKRMDKATGEIVVKLSAKSATTCSFELSYVVDNASWTPTYEIRANQVGDPVNIAYKAEIRQNTKETWENVKLTLSSANPNVSGQAPKLNKYVLEEYRPKPMYRKSARNMLMLSKVTKGIMEEEVMADYAMAAPAPMVVQDENMTANEFEIQMPYTLVSNNQSSTVEIENYKLDAEYEYYCAPKLDKDAFLIARVTDWEKLNLMSGEASLFFENTYVGKTRIESTQQSDTLKLSLGRDKGIVVKRNEISDYSSSKILSGKKVVEKGWRITVRNSKSKNVQLSIHDQIPVSGQSDIEVTQVDISGASKNNETGELVWKMNLKPSEQKDVVLKYKVKYSKDKNICIE